MLDFAKDLARTFLNLPRSGRIFLEWPSDTLEPWDRARRDQALTLVLFYCEECLASELLLRTARFLEPDVRNHGRCVFLSDRHPAARELAAKLGVDRLPQLVLTDREGLPLRRFGGLTSPVEVLDALLAAEKANPPAAT